MKFLYAILLACVGMGIALAGSVGPLPPNGARPQIELPNELHTRNTCSPPGAGVRCLGLCVFTSARHACLWQDIDALEDWPAWIREQRIQGGGYPSKFDDLARARCKAKGVPVPDYIHVEGDDIELIKLALASRRMVCSTYGYSPTGRYNGQSIAHMVNTIHGRDGVWGILDNNYPGADAYEWLSDKEYLDVTAPMNRQTGKRAGWWVIFLGSPPPPVLSK